MIGSDVVGFAGVELPFYVVVGTRELAFSKPFVHMISGGGQQITTTPLRNTLLLDGAVISSTNLSSVTAKVPSWLSFDNSTFVLSGTAPTNSSTTNVTVTATDVFGDVANAIVSIDITGMNSTYFVNSLGPFNATIGSSFSFNLSSAFVDPSRVSVTVSELPVVSWLSFNTSTFVLSGNVPRNYAVGSLQITINATARLSKRAISQDGTSQTFTLNIQPEAIITPSTSSSPSNVASTTTTNDRSGPSAGQLVAAILTPILTLVLLALVFWFCCLRKRRTRSVRSKTPDKSDISNPLRLPGVVDEKYIHPALRIKNDSIHDECGDSNLDDTYMTGANESSVFERRSRSLVTMITSPRMAYLRASESHPRSFSDNGYRPSDDSWRSTEEGSYPTMRSQLTGSMMTRNFSRKSDPNMLTRENSYMVREDSEDFAMPLSVAKDDGNIQYGKYRISTSSVQPDFGYGTSEDVTSCSKRSTPNFIGAAPSNFGKRLSGMGHGLRRSRNSASSLSSSERRRSRSRSIGVGHGFGRPNSYVQAGDGAVRKSNSWMTIQTGQTRPTRPASQMSGITESTNILHHHHHHPDAMKTTIRVVPESPASSSMLSTNSKFAHNNGYMYARPVSRRDPSGTSPFFAPSTSRASSAARSGRRQSPMVGRNGENIHEEAEEIPTVPYSTVATSSSLERQIRAGLGSMPEEDMRDSLGITYGQASSATDHLRNFVQSMSSRLSWKTPKPTPQMEEHNASRFASVETSRRNSPVVTLASHKRSPARHSLLGGNRPPLYQTPTSISDSEFYDRASLASLRDSNGNIIQYEIDESPELGQAVARPSLSKPFLSFQNRPELVRKSTLTIRAKETFHHEGPAKRPISVDPGFFDLDNDENAGVAQAIRKQKSFVASEFGGTEGRRSSVGPGRESLESPAFL